MTVAASAGLAPLRERLANGVVVLAKETRTTPAVTISAAFQAGSVFDPPELPGLAHFAGRLLDRGTAGRSADAIAEELDNRGVSLQVSVTRHLLTLGCSCLVEDFEPVLELVGEIGRQPTFPEGEIAKRRGELITALRQDEDNPSARAMEALFDLLYGRQHPYGRRPKGSLETAERLTRPALVRFHEERFRPSSLSLAIVGDVAPHRAVAAVDRVLGTWRGEPAAAAALPPAPRPARRRQLVISMMNKAQVEVAYGFAAIARADPAYYAYWLMNNIFGQYSLGGRLGDNIRERQGLAYYVFSSFDANAGEGPLLVRAGVDPAHVDRVLAAIDEEMAKMAADGATERELAESRQYLVGSLPRMLETNAGIAAFLQTAEHFGLGLDHDRRLPGLLGAVTLDEVRAAAAATLVPGRAAVVIAGPYPSDAAPAAGAASPA